MTCHFPITTTHFVVNCQVLNIQDNLSSSEVYKSVQNSFGSNIFPSWHSDWMWVPEHQFQTHPLSEI